MPLIRTDEEFIEYFKSKIRVTPGCWIWEGSIGSMGYGKLGRKKKHLLAHRFSYEVYIGPIPNGIQVCHTCDNRRCVNPDHFFLGSALDNARDRVSKGRCYHKHERHWNAKITKEQAEAIRNDSRPSEEIAKDYPINRRMVSSIKNGTSWRNDGELRKK